MKLLPFVTVAVAEKRFLTAGTGKSRIDANKNLLFDTVVNDDAGTSAATGAFSVTSQAVFIGAKEDANRPKGLVDGDTYTLAVPATTTAIDATWKKQARLVKNAAGSGVSISNDTQLPNCDNTFIEGTATASSAKLAIAPNNFTEDATTNVKMGLAAGKYTSEAFAATDFLYYACKAGVVAYTNLTCGTVYKLGTVTGDKAILLKSDGTAGPMGKATHAAPATGTWFIKVQSATPKTLSVCTAKASATRMTAFISGMIAYALLI